MTEVEFEKEVKKIFDEAYTLLIRKHRDYGPKNISSAPPILFTPIRIQYFLIKVLISFSIVGISLCSLNTIQKKNIFIAEIISRKLVKKATNLYTSNNYTTLLFKQPWAYFSINPPKQIGYITLIGVQKNKQLIDISTIQPFSNSTINPIKFEGFWQKIFYLISTLIRITITT